MKRDYMENIRFEIYTESHADAVAAMWSESREGWPPGFLGASEFTAASVEMEENSSGKLFTVLAIENTRIVGYCRTTPYGGEPDAAYVALLNVVPDLHGRKIGKNLLLDAVTKTADSGYYRIDLHTWPANLKAMPLYKKTGFFWVPDSMVYMQNYMPFLLGRTEFRDFLGDRNWYDCFVRELEVEPDEQKTPNGREVFNYFFKIEEKSFRAEFDRRGRILSALETPSSFMSVTKNKGNIFFGESVRIKISGNSLPQKLPVESHKYLSAPESVTVKEASEGFNIVPEPVQVPIPDRDRSPRVSTVLPGENPLEIGIGIRAEEPLSILSSPVRRISPGQKELTLDLRKVAEVDSFRLEASLNGKSFLNESYSLESIIFQRISIPLPEFAPGTNELGLLPFCDGTAGAEEKIILVSGPYTESPKAFLTRKTAVIAGKDISLAVTRTGAMGTVWIPGEDDREEVAAYIGINAGPPYWNSDLPHQLYDISIRDNDIIAAASWPSRPGLSNEISYRHDPAGFVEVRSSVINNSSHAQKVSFVAKWGGALPFLGGTRIIPLKKGTFTCREVYNQIPDQSEDYPGKISDLGAPWLAVSNGKKSLMAWFPLWDTLQFGSPQAEEMLIAPGASVQAPSFRMLLSGGELKDLLRNAKTLGWNTGSVNEKTGFINHNLEPVMIEGYELRLSHNLFGKRRGSINIDGVTSAEGFINNCNMISAHVAGTGTREVSLNIAGRDTVYPTRIVSRNAKSAEVLEEDGILKLSNGRLKALIDPSEFGHVYSLRLDGVENLMSSHPGPSDFGWEKPWFGGIHPRIMDGRENPFKLDTVNCHWVKFETFSGGLPEKGWEMRWKVNHKKFGSLDLTWRVSLLPEVPVLRTWFCPEATNGAYLGGEFDIRGFLEPGGELGNVVHTAQSMPLLRQGREHAGAWFDTGRWARVESPGKGFVEAYSLKESFFLSEDYADKGCHLAVINALDRRREIEMFWILGNGADDEVLSGIFRKHLSVNL